MKDLSYLNYRAEQLFILAQEAYWEAIHLETTDHRHEAWAKYHSLMAAAKFAEQTHQDAVNQQATLTLTH